VRAAPTYVRTPLIKDLANVWNWASFANGNCGQVVFYLCVSKKLSREKDLPLHERTPFSNRSDTEKDFLLFAFFPQQMLVVQLFIICSLRNSLCPLLDTFNNFLDHLG